MSFAFKGQAVTSGSSSERSLCRQHRRESRFTPRTLGNRRPVIFTALITLVLLFATAQVHRGGAQCFFSTVPRHMSRRAAEAHQQSESTGEQSRRMALIALAPAAMAASQQAAFAGEEPRTKFKNIRTQFIAALGDPNARSGTGAQFWGLWRKDPGPRGVQLPDYQRLKNAGGLAPAQWQFDDTDWWLEEHGLIMEKPDFPVSAGKYLVTGGRKVTTELTIYPPDETGAQRWELGSNAKLYDVTHLPCRSARYTPAQGGNSCSPAKAQESDFPVTPGGPMPPVAGCDKQDYAVIFVIGVQA